MPNYKPDKSLSIIIGILLAFGFLILSSAGMAEGQEKFGSSQYFLFKQIKNGLLPGLALFWLFSRIKYKFWKKAAAPLLLGSVFLVMMVFSSFGETLKGASRWLTIGPFLFQPSEILKLGVIIYFAAWFDRRYLKMDSWSHSVAPLFVILGFISILLVLQPDLGTLVSIALIALVIYFSAGVNLKYLFIIGVILLLAFGAFVYMESYRVDRIMAYLNPAHDIQGKSYHARQAILGIGSGGLFGVGFGKGQQKATFLPEAAGDSIFAVLAEELGLVGAGFLIILFLILSIKLVKIAKYAPDIFSQLIVVGVLTWIIGQAFINIGAVTGLLPLTGIPLPFVSYGGTALVMILAALGIVNNISKYAKP